MAMYFSQGGNSPTMQWTGGIQGVTPPSSLGSVIPANSYLQQSPQLMQIHGQDIRTLQYPIQEMQIMNVAVQEVEWVPVTVPMMEQPMPPSPRSPRERSTPKEEREMERAVQQPAEEKYRIVEVPVQKIVEKIVEVKKEVVEYVNVEEKIEVPIEVIKEKYIDVPIEKYYDSIVERIVPQHIDKYVEVPIEKLVYIEVPVDRVMEKVIERDTPKFVETIVDVPVERVIHVQVPIEKVVEKVVRRQAQEPLRVSNVGIGLLLEQSGQDNMVRVQQIVPGFAADISGQFRIGDILVAIDNQDIRPFSLDDIRRLTYGPEGSLVKLQMLQGGVHPYSVVLLRSIQSNRSPQ